jgi:hypothetical protein
MYEHNPFILESEHKRILASTQKRCDEKLADERKLGFWRGFSLTCWIAAVATVVGVGIGYAIGDDPVTSVCVPLYDQTGLERCQ